MGIFSFLNFFKAGKKVSDIEKLSLLRKYLMAIDSAIKLYLVDIGGVDIQQQKPKLARGLFMIGAIDSASQSSKLNDHQFIELALIVFSDMGYNDDLRNKLIKFHQGTPDQDYVAYSAIMMGGQCFTELVKGHTDAPFGGGAFLIKQIDNPKFPASL